jgi:anti-anti-sigma factor
MELQAAKIGKYLVVKASGRLDAAWSDYFTDNFLNYIRNGEHELVIEAAALNFLSSAGIRSLVRINKELAVVKGSFLIVHANDFVSSTLTTTGFGTWLSETMHVDLIPNIEIHDTSNISSSESYTLNPKGSLTINLINGWQNWKVINESEVKKTAFSRDIFALGIGSTSTELTKARDHFGEMMAVGGNLIYQVPEEQGHPDYLLALNEFIPEMSVLQALICQGEMSGMFRFSPSDDKPEVNVSELAGQVLSLTKAPVAGFVVIAEIAGLVGANLIQSPGKIGDQPILDLFEIRDWLSFSGEKVFSGEQALLFGVIARSSEIKNSGLLKPLPSHPDLAGHMHAAVFPYQPMPNGKIDLKQQTDKFFAGSPPLALMHLIDDNRPVQGLGESSFIRGACWYAPITNTEILL